jgi:rubrerythrin
MERTITLTEDTRSIVKMLANHELALKELYQTYAERVPACKDLWLRLVQDEQRHSDWLESLVSGLGPADPLSSCGWPRRAAIESSLKYIQVQILRARQAEVTPLGALSIAKDLENALIEKEFFKIADGACPEVREVLGRLIAGTKKHGQMVAEALAAARLSARQTERA